MEPLKQGEILRLENPAILILVLSKEYFNQTGMIIACPIAKSAPEDALHIPVETDKMNGIAMLEQLRSIDIRARHYARISELSFNQIQNISDAVQGIFDYIWSYDI